MPYRGDDLAPLLIPSKKEGVGFRQGIVLSYDQTTGENAVQVGGSIVTDLPILNTSEALLLAPGAVVGILTAGSAWFIMGRLTVPGTADALSALSALRTESATETNNEAVTSTSYTDLATIGPSVTTTIGPSGRCLVIVSADIHGNAVTGQAIATGSGYMSFAATGANTISAIDSRAALAWLRYNASPNSTMAIDIRVGASRLSLLTGLNPGETTFTAKYRRDGTGTTEFDDRNITVMAI